MKICPRESCTTAKLDTELEAEGKGKGKGRPGSCREDPGPNADTKRDRLLGTARGDGEREGSTDGDAGVRRALAALGCEVWRPRVRARVDGRGARHQYCNCMHSSWLRAPAKPVCVDNGRAGVDGAARYMIRPRAMRGRRVNGWGRGVWGPSWCNGWVSWAAGGLGTNERWAASEVDWIGVVD